VNSAAEAILATIPEQQDRPNPEFSHIAGRPNLCEAPDKNQTLLGLVENPRALPIQQRMVENLTKADPMLGKRVAKGLKL
jgi:catalase